MRDRDDSFDDYERYDNEPERSKSKDRTLLIVLSVVGGVVLLVILACAGLIYWGVNSFAKLPLLPIVAESDLFLNDIKAGQVDVAYARTTKGFQARQTLPQFQTFVKQHPALTAQTSRTYTGFNVFTGTGAARGTVHATVVGPGNSLSFTLVFTEENGQWKIDQLTIP